MNSYTTHVDTCSNCGGAIFHGDGVFGWGGKICYCWRNAKPAYPPLKYANNPIQTPAFNPQKFYQPYAPNPPKVISQGWECPRCRKIHAPSITGCNCAP